MPSNFTSNKTEEIDQQAIEKIYNWRFQKIYMWASLI